MYIYLQEHSKRCQPQNQPYHRFLSSTNLFASSLWFRFNSNNQQQESFLRKRDWFCGIRQYLPMRYESYDDIISYC